MLFKPSRQNALPLIVVSALVLALGIALGAYFGFDIGFERAVRSNIDSFDDCVRAGNAIMESYPRRCSADEKVYTEDIGNELEKAELIRVENPRPNKIITSPLEIVGTARGTWFFEATFPVVLYDEESRVVAEGFAEAKDDWMTEDFVPFKATLSFSEVMTDQGDLVLEKSNPSGLPENDDELIIPIRFK